MNQNAPLRKLTTVKIGIAIQLILNHLLSEDKLFELSILNI